MDANSLAIKIKIFQSKLIRKLSPTKQQEVKIPEGGRKTTSKNCLES